MECPKNYETNIIEKKLSCQENIGVFRSIPSPCLIFSAFLKVIVEIQNHLSLSISIRVKFGRREKCSCKSRASSL